MLIAQVGRRSSLLIERSWKEVCNPLRHVSARRRLWLVQGGYRWQSYLSELILEVHLPILSFSKRAKFASIKCFLRPMILLRQFFRGYPTLASGRTLAH